MLLFRLGGHVVVQQVRGTRLSLGALGGVVSVAGAHYAQNKSEITGFSG